MRAVRNGFLPRKRAKGAEQCIQNLAIFALLCGHFSVDRNSTSIGNRQSEIGNTRAGFSMLEMILVLVIIGIVGVLSGPIIAPVLRGTVQGGVEHQTAEEAYWAASRMTSIASRAIGVQLPSAQELQVQLYDGGASNWHTFAYADGQLTYDNVLFWGNLNSFSASTNSSLISLDVQLVDAQHPTINLDIHTRNL